MFTPFKFKLEQFVIYCPTGNEHEIIARLYPDHNVALQGLPHYLLSGIGAPIPETMLTTAKDFEVSQILDKQAAGNSYDVL